MPNDKSDELVRVRSKFMAAWIVKRLGVDQKVGRRILTSHEGTSTGMTSGFQTTLAQLLAITFFS